MFEKTRLIQFEHYAMNTCTKILHGTQLICTFFYVEVKKKETQEVDSGQVTKGHID
jgi:hypothetical protein